MKTEKKPAFLRMGNFHTGPVCQSREVGSGCHPGGLPGIVMPIRLPIIPPSRTSLVPIFPRRNLITKSD